MAKVVAAIAGQLNHIGRAGENLATIVSFDVSDWKAPNDSFSGVFSLYVQQTGVGYYLQSITQPNTPGKNNGDTVLWEVTNSNTATIGAGKCELVYSEVSTSEKPQMVGTWDNNSFYVPGIGIIFYIENEVKYLTPNANSFYLYVDELSQKKFYIEGGIFYEAEEADDPHLYQSQVIKSVIYDIIVTTALDLEAAIEIPDPIQVWLEELRSLAEAVSQGAFSYYLSEQYAKGTRNGVPIGQDDEGYHDNSKFYRDQSADCAIEAQEYLTNLQNSQIGTVTTLPPTDSTHLANATVSVQNVNDRLTFNFGIPAGLPGISGSGSGGLVVTFTMDPQTQEVTVDKTYSEILTAINNNQIVTGFLQSLNDNNNKVVYQLESVGSFLGLNEISFQHTGIEDNNDSVEYFIEQCNIDSNNEATYSIHSYYLSKSQPVSGNITIWGE